MFRTFRNKKQKSNKIRASSKTEFLTLFALRKRLSQRESEEVLKISNLKVAIVFIFVFLLFSTMDINPIFALISDDDDVALMVNIQGALVLECDSNVNFGLIKFGETRSAMHQCTVTTDSVTGYNLSVRRDDFQTTLDKTVDSSINIADKYDWDASANSGWGNAEPFVNTGLGFNLYATMGTKNDNWWGNGTICHDDNNLYSGFPSSYQVIMVHPSYSSISTVSSICCRLGILGTQEAGVYQGTITYQAVVNP